MQAFMPQKDTALILVRAARSLIAAVNVACAEPAGGTPRCLMLPSFPLFAFADELPPGGFCGCRILAPLRERGCLVFPVELDCRAGAGGGYGAAGAGGTESLRIVFARAEDGGRADPSAPPLPSDYENRELFPLRPRVFRTGRVELGGGSWEVWDERWHKLPS